MALSVFFHGKYIPLQGVLYIIEAAKQLEKEDFAFTLIGGGQTFVQTKALAEKLSLANISFVERVPFEQLPLMLHGADVILGIFGDTEKATRVIPNKVYEGAALGKAMVTSDTPAIREVFTDGTDILLCRIADPSDLAEKLRLLNQDRAMLKKLGEGALGTFKKCATPSVIGKNLIADFASFAQ